jgi:hypothetical protein
MGKILNVVYVFKKKQAKKSIFAPKIALRVERSDPARNSYFPADFLSARLQCSQLLWNSAKIKAVVYRRAQGEQGLDIAQTFGLNCSMTHSPGKIEYNCRYCAAIYYSQLPAHQYSLMAARAISLSACRLGPPGGNGTWK